VRAILIPRPPHSQAQQHQPGQPTTVIISPTGSQLCQQPQLQPQQIAPSHHLQSINTPLPNIQLPSEPLPITAQEMQQHLSAFSSPSTSPASESGPLVKTLDSAINGFPGSITVSGVHPQDGALKQASLRPQQNPQKIFYQVFFLQKTTTLAGYDLTTLSVAGGDETSRPCRQINIFYQVFS
jgi:hypothetical protein